MSSCSLFFDRDRPQEERPLPEITAEGANTFGCRINGDKYVPYSCHLFFPSQDPGYGYTDDWFSLATRQLSCDESVDRVLGMVLQRPVVGDTIWLGTYGTSINERSAFFYDAVLNENYETWNEDSLFYSGYVHIHAMNLEIDSCRCRFVAGTFEFSARDNHLNQVIEVTEGRFDVALNK